MIKLAEAISRRFPQGNEWAAQALGALEDALDPATPVHDVAEGWTQRGTYSDVHLVDTLFVLAADRLGLGQVAGAPRWIDLAQIAAVDAVDDSPLPLQTIELELRTGEVICVGWPDTFTMNLVPVLVSLAEGDAAPSAAAVPPPYQAPNAPLSGPAPALDFLRNSPPAAPAPARYVPEPPPFDIAAFDPRIGDPDAVDEWFSPETDLPGAALEVQAFADSPSLTEPPPGLSFAPEVEPAPEVDATPPWQNPGMVWPDPLRGVLYLGGHPGYPRKRKNGTMVFSPTGLDAKGTGFQDWDMAMDWAYVDGVDIQGPDEVMFTDHLKIDSTSSALIVTMTDGTRMFFEIRTRRPPSLRSALAPVLQMVGSIRTYRAQH